MQDPESLYADNPDAWARATLGGRPSKTPDYPLPRSGQTVFDDADTAWHVPFCLAYAESANTTRACVAANVDLAVVRRAQRNDPDFADMFATARQAAIDAAWAVVWQEAVLGIERPIFRQGKQVGVYRQRDTKLLQFVLKVLDPATFSERAQIAAMGIAAVGDLEQRRSQALAEAQRRAKLLVPGRADATPPDAAATDSA